MNSLFIYALILSFAFGYMIRRKYHRDLPQTSALLSENDMPHMFIDDVYSQTASSIVDFSRLQNIGDTLTNASAAKASITKAMTDGLTFYTINIGLPALAFCSSLLIDTSVGIKIFEGAIVAWLSFFATVFLIAKIGQKMQMEKKTIACLMLTGGLASTAMLGYPMVSIVYGPEEMIRAVMLDQFGSFLILSTMGTLIVQWGSGLKLKTSEMVLGILKFPAFPALVVGLILNLTHVHIPFQLEELVDIAGKSIAVSSIMVLGLQTNFNNLSALKKEIALGLTVKLIILPLMAVIIMMLFGISNLTAIAQLALPTLLSASVIATKYDLNPPLAALMPTMGLILAVATLPIWITIAGLI